MGTLLLQGGSKGNKMWRTEKASRGEKRMQEVEGCIIKDSGYSGKENTTVVTKHVLCNGE